MPDYIINIFFIFKLRFLRFAVLWLQIDSQSCTKFHYNPHSGFSSLTHLSVAILAANYVLGCPFVCLSVLVNFCKQYILTLMTDLCQIYSHTPYILLWKLFTLVSKFGIFIRVIS